MLFSIELKKGDSCCQPLPKTIYFYSKQSLIHFGSFLASLWTCCFSKTSIMLCSSLGTLVWLSFFELSLLVGVNCSNCNCCDHEKRNQKSRKMLQSYSLSLFSWYVLFTISLFKVKFLKKPLSFWTIWTLKVSNNKMAHLLRRVQIDLWALTILWPWKTDIGIKNQKPNTLEAASKNSGASALRECAWINVIRRIRNKKSSRFVCAPNVFLFSNWFE